MSTVYVVNSPGDDGVFIERVYTYRAEAEAFVEAYNATSSGRLSVDEYPLGAPAAKFDGPVWVGQWRTRRKLKGEKQLVIVADGFTMVVPSATSYTPSDLQELRGGFTGPRYSEYFAPVEYEEPPVWIDTFDYQQQWHTGDTPPAAEVSFTNRMGSAWPGPNIVVRGTSREAVETLLRETALQIKEGSDD